MTAAVVAASAGCTVPRGVSVDGVVAIVGPAPGALLVVIAPR